MEYRRLYVFGASGHGKVVTELVYDNNSKIEAVIDDEPKMSFFGKTPILNATEMAKPSKYNAMIIAIGNNKNRKKISLRYKEHSFFTIKHKTAFVSPSVVLGNGTVVMLYAIINTGAKIGNHVIINTAAIIEHDCIIEDYVHISPNVTLSGNIKIGEGSHLGTGTIVIPGVKIGKWCTIGAGSVVISDIPDGATVVGNPGKIIKNNYISEFSGDNKNIWNKKKVINFNPESEDLKRITI